MVSDNLPGSGGVSRSDGRSGTKQQGDGDGGGGLPESVHEALFLFITAGLGLVLNVAVIACILASRRQRRVTNSFVVHGCALDAVKCAYCVPFATSLLRDVAPGFCAVLGGSESLLQLSFHSCSFTWTMAVRLGGGILSKCLTYQIVFGLSGPVFPQQINLPLI